MYKNQAKHSLSYTDSLLTLMNYNFLKYVDHYYVGTSITKKAQQYVDANNYEVVYQKNKDKRKVAVTHTILSYEDFLQHEYFNIAEGMDPNTESGFYHNVFNCLEFDKSESYKRIEEQRSNLSSLLTDTSFKSILGIIK